MDEKLLNVKETAELLGYQPSTIYAKAAAGLLPRVIMWRGARKDAIRFSRTSLEEFIRENTVKGG